MGLNNGMPKNKKIIKKFATTFLATLGIFLAAFVVVVAGLNFFGGNVKEGESGNSTAKSNSIFDIFNKKEEKIYGLLLGVDDAGTHTDTIILGCFDPETEEISLISLPRDTKIIFSTDTVSELVALGSPLHQSGIVKLTEVYHFAYFADKEKAVDYLVQEIDTMLGVEVDFYVKVDFEAFCYLVDEIGGVEFDVPERMFYSDPTQDLYIDLQPGVQLLDGKNAEDLVRYRSYSNADIMRMQVQQSFIKAFVKQALAKENIVQNMTAMVTAALKYVETDFDMTTLPKYVKYISTFNADNIHTYTLPIERTEVINGKEFVILDEEGSRDLVDEVFFGKTTVVTEESTDKRIKVLNGGGASGLAKSGKDLLELKGFTVSDIGDYTGIKADGTRIFVAQRGYGEDIKAIFTDSNIVYDPSQDADYDIIVVIGRNGIE